MNSQRFELRWVGYYEPGNKVWGWFVDLEQDKVPPSQRPRFRNSCYCFWAVCGKTISMNKHSFHSWNMDELEKKKLANKYQQIDSVALLEMWPTFYEDLHNKFVFATLADHI